MKPEDALTYMTIMGGLGTAINVWLTLSTRNAILTLKLWTRENFVSKDDLPNFLQLAESKARVVRTTHER